MKYLKPFLSVALVIIVSAINLFSQEREDLLFEEIPIVITASRKYQRITECPSTVTVITKEDIKYSGANTIPDVLRMVAGVDVMSLSLRDQQVGIRGFNSYQSNKLLVMIDGYSVYEEIYGSVFWDFLPVHIEEIKQIEVVRSPVSSLYGANAFNGVINIITLKAEEIDGGRLFLSTGNPGGVSGGVVYGNSGKLSSLRVTGSWEKPGEWGHQDSDASDIFRGSLQFVLKTGKDSGFKFYGARVNSDSRFIKIGNGFNNSKMSGNSEYLQMEFHTDKLKIKGNYSSFDVDTEIPLMPQIMNGKRQTWDLEVLYNIDTGKKSSLVFGGNWKHNHIEGLSVFTGRMHQSLWAMFAEQDLLLSRKLRVTFGARFDRHPLVKNHFSPRGSIFFKLGKSSVMRFSVSQAFHNPSFVNSYININYQMDMEFYEKGNLLSLPVMFHTLGNKDLKSEKVTSYEFGFNHRISEDFKFTINLFYNKYDNFINGFNKVEYWKPNELADIDNERVAKKVVYQFMNEGHAWSVGGELEGSFRINPSFSGFFNYSWLHVVREEDNPETFSINEKDMKDSEFPTHKVNIGVRGKLNTRLSAGITMNWVGRVERFVHDITTNQDYKEKREAYVIFNGSLCYKVSKKVPLELRLSLFNLFNNKHHEYFYNNYSDLQKIGRKVILGIKYSF